MAGPLATNLAQPISHLDHGVRVADGPAVVGDGERDALLAVQDLADLAQLVGALLLGDAVQGEAALRVQHQAEELAGLLDLDNVLRSSGRREV